MLEIALSPPEFLSQLKEIKYLFDEAIEFNSRWGLNYLNKVYPKDHVQRWGHLSTKCTKSATFALHPCTQTNKNQNYCSAILLDIDRRTWWTMGDFSRVCLRNCGSGGVVDVPASEVTYTFISTWTRVLEFDDRNPHQAEAGVQLIVYGDQHGGENQVITWVLHFVSHLLPFSCFLLFPRRSSPGSCSENHVTIGLIRISCCPRFSPGVAHQEPSLQLSPPHFSLQLTKMERSSWRQQVKSFPQLYH